MQTSRTKIKVYTLSMALTVEENVLTAIEVASGENVEITVAQRRKSRKEDGQLFTAPK